MGKKRGEGEQKNSNVSDINKLIAKFLHEVADDFSDSPKLKNTKEPIVYGVNVKVGPNGRADVETFGNVKPSQQRVMVEEKREPLVDIIEKARETTVIAEMPGVEKRSIRVRATHNELKIDGKSKETKYSRKIRLQSTIDPQGGVAKFKNGVLEITFARSEYTSDSKVIKVTD